MNYFYINLIVLFCLVQGIENNLGLVCTNFVKNICQICYQSIKPLQIITCKVSCNYQSANNSTKCVNNVKQLTNTNECLSACCNTTYFQQCLNQSIRPQATNLTAIIVCVVVVPVSFVIAVCLYNKYFKLNDRTFNTVIKEPENIIHKHKNGSIWFKKDESQIQLQFMMVSQQNVPKQQQSPCAICLQFNFNLKTSCDHSFHVVCFIGWIKRNQFCPLCISREYNYVKIECQKCRRRQIRCRLYKSNERLMKYSFINLQKNQKIICTSCKKTINGQLDQIQEDAQQFSMNIIMQPVISNEEIHNEERVTTLGQQC